MPPSSSPWPFEHPEQLADALREQGAAPEEIDDLLPALSRLSEWQAPQPSPADTQRLLARLMPQMPARSPVRQAIRAHQRRQGLSSAFLLSLARTQVSLFGWAFWWVSALVTLVSIGVVLGSVQPDQGEPLLRAIGPFLAYLGAVIAFRRTGVQVLEGDLHASIRSLRGKSPGGTGPA